MFNGVSIFRLIAVALIFVGFENVGTLGMSEEDRLIEHRKLYKSWPPPFIPNTEGWIRLMKRRMAQVAAISGRHEKYDGWMQVGLELSGSWRSFK